MSSQQNFYQRVMATLGTVVAFCTCSLGAQEVSQAQFSRDKEMIRKQIESLVDAEFAGAKMGMELLQKPLAVGDKVTIEMRRGGSVEIVDGTFKGLVGQYVRISSKNILLKDVPEMQRDRFTIAQFPERREQILAENQQKLGDAMEFRRRQLRPSVLRDTGYDNRFFDGNVSLGERIYPKARLGEGEVFAVLSAVEGEELVSCRVINRSRMSISGVAVLGNSGVGTSGREEDVNASWGAQFDFYLPRTRITAIDRFVADLRVMCHSPKMGTWKLRALPKTKRKVTSINRGGGPKKVHQILISFTFDDFEKADMLSLKVAELTPVETSLYRRRVAEALVLQGEMQALRQEIAARAAEAAAILAAQEASATGGGPGVVAGLPAAPAVSPLNQDALKPVIAGLKDSGIEIKPLDASQSSKDTDVGSEVVANHLAPKAVSQAAIAGATEWARIQPTFAEGSLKLEFAERRYLLGTRGDAPVAFIQLSSMFSSDSAAVEDYRVLLGAPDGEIPQKKITFKTPIDWVGKLYLYQEVPVDSVNLEAGALNIDVKRDAQ